VEQTGDVSVRGLESEYLFDDNMVVNKHDTILLIGTTTVKIPAGSNGLLVEGTEEGLFDIVRDSHVILDRVEAAKDNIEQAYLR
jgi:hypothetical protein